MKMRVVRISCGAALSLAASVILVWQPLAAKPLHITKTGSPKQTSLHVRSMSEERFWEIIDRSRDPDPSTQLRLLRQEFETLTPEQLVSWEITFDQQMRRSYRWDLWGAAYVAMGGASDDGFEYFRLWLISQGRDVFNKVMADPDSLVEFVPSDPNQMDFEDFAHVAPDVWSTKTGKKWDDMPNISSFFDPMGYGLPIGTEFPEDPAYLANKYPKLWRKFGIAN